MSSCDVLGWVAGAAGNRMVDMAGMVSALRELPLCLGKQASCQILTSVVKKAEQAECGG